MSKKFVPLHDKVLIKPLSKEEQTYGNIIIPDLGRERAEAGKVESVGPGRTTEFGILIGPQVKPGDTVMIPKAGAVLLDLDGEDYYVVQDKEILVIIEEI
jgi:chaperonin GroES